MPYTLPSLPYAGDALEPFIDQHTMELHHGRHHLAYVTALNLALEHHSELQAMSIEELLRSVHSLPHDVRLAVVPIGWSGCLRTPVAPERHEANERPICPALAPESTIHHLNRPEHGCSVPAAPAA